MMSAPLPDWIAAVMRAWRSFALIVSSVTSIFICRLYSAIIRLSSASPSGMKSTHWRRWSFVGWAKAGATPPPAARSPRAPEVLRKVRREVFVMYRLLAPASVGRTSAGWRESPRFAHHCQAAFGYLRRYGPGPGEGAYGIADRVGASRAVAHLAGHGHALLPHGRADAGDRKHLHQARGPGLPSGDDGPAGPRLSRPAGRRPRRGGGRGRRRVPGSLRAAAPRAGRPRGGRGRRRPAGRRRAAPGHRRQRRLVVGRRVRVPGLRRRDRHPLLH